MIERQFVSQKKKEFQIQSYIIKSLRRAGLSHVKIQRTPLGERIIVFTSRPGLVVGRGGTNIKKLTNELKSKFKLENPQIEISEVKDVNLNARIVAERIALSLERYGSRRFKAIIHKAVEDITKAGALGVEIIISGKVPSARARSWRVYSGYLRKCGEGAIEEIDRATTQARLKSGIVGVKVNITPPDINLVDRVTLKKEEETTKAGAGAETEENKAKTIEEGKKGTEKKEGKNESKEGSEEKQVVKNMKKRKRGPKTLTKNPVKGKRSVKKSKSRKKSKSKRK